MKKKKICVFLERWKSGGIESVISNILLHLDPGLYCADIVAECIGESIFTDKLIKVGVNFIPLSGKLRSGKNRSAFKKLLSEKKYDIIHLHIFHAVALKYAKIAERLGVEVRIVHAHGAGLRNSPLRWLKLTLHRLARKKYCDSVTARIACSREAGEFLYGNKDFTVIANGVDTDKFAYSPEARKEVREELGVSGVLLGAVGRLSPEKNQSFAIDVFAEYRKTHKDARLLITGEGEMQKALENRALSLGVSDAVIMLGASDHVERLMLAMDILLFPSTVEGFGIVAIEAETSGLPVLASCGVPECVALSERMKRVPLEAGAVVWAEEADKLLSEYPERKDMGDLIRSAGYSAEAVAGAVIRYYQGDER